MSDWVIHIKYVIESVCEYVSECECVCESVSDF